MTQQDRLQIVMGALAPSLKIQLIAAGFKPDREKLKHLQKDADAITRLSIRGYLPDSVRERCRKRVVKEIEEAVK